MVDVNEVVGKLLPITQEVMTGAIKAGGVTFWGTLQEMTAGAKFLKDAPARFPNNPYIAAVPGMLQSNNQQNAESKQSADLNTIDLHKVVDDAAALNPMLNELGAQGDEIRLFLVGLAHSIVAAAGDGLFGSGQKINPNEQRWVDDLAEKLGLSKTPPPEAAPAQPEAPAATAGAAPAEVETPAEPEAPATDAPAQPQ